MDTWLVTGGAGFIGANFIERTILRYPHIKLIVLDSLTYAGDLHRIRHLIESNHVIFQQGDIRDTRLLEDLFKTHQVSHIIHFAAESHVDRSIDSPAVFLDTNIYGTFALLETARKNWLPEGGGKFIHVSTDEVYGTLESDMPPFVEESPYQPNSPYSASKAASDHLVRAWFQSYKLPAIITHCSNNYGPWQHPEKLIPSMIIKALSGDMLPVYGDGLQIRDWIYVKDHCDALLTIIERGRCGETYNIGGNNELRNIDVVTKICDYVDELTHKSKGTTRSLIEHVSDRPAHDRRYAINNNKMMREFTWSPKFDFDYNLNQTIRWYIEKDNWIKSLK